jgi:hypothetical protein
MSKVVIMEYKYYRGYKVRSYVGYARYGLKVYGLKYIDFKG